MLRLFVFETSFTGCSDVVMLKGHSAELVLVVTGGRFANRDFIARVSNDRNVRGFASSRSSRLCSRGNVAIVKLCIGWRS